MIEFQGWPKTPRLNRPITITEKIDGTNAAIIIEDHGPPLSLTVPTDAGAVAAVIVDDREYQVGAQSRKRVLQLGQDNFGFALWAATHAEDLVRALGPGRHFGEWWGHGIQRGYGLAKGQRAFSLFNTHRYGDVSVLFDDDTALGAVPVLAELPTFDTGEVNAVLNELIFNGSRAARGFMKPEGIIVYHSASNSVFKVLAENDDQPKGEA